MDIAAMNLRITFQKHVVSVDEYGNRRNDADDYITCWATESGKGAGGSIDGDENQEAGRTVPQETVDFTTRWCKALSRVTSDNYRIIADGKLYNILFVDPMGYKHKCLKFHCERVER